MTQPESKPVYSTTVNGYDADVYAVEASDNAPGGVEYVVIFDRPATSAHRRAKWADDLDDAKRQARDGVVDSFDWDDYLDELS